MTVVTEQKTRSLIVFQYLSNSTPLLPL